jgi:hypothetical protein
MKKKPITIQKLPLILATMKNSFPDAPIFEKSSPKDWKLIAEVWNMAISDGVHPEEYFTLACKELNNNIDETFLFYANIMAQIEQDCYSATRLN